MRCPTSCSAHIGNAPGRNTEYPVYHGTIDLLCVSFAVIDNASREKRLTVHHDCIVRDLVYHSDHCLAKIEPNWANWSCASSATAAPELECLVTAKYSK